MICESPSNGVDLPRLNRPDTLNALSLPLRAEVAKLVVGCDADPSVKAIVITSSDTAFAAGTDLVEVQRRSVRDEAFQTSRVAWIALENCRKPVTAAVKGFALGGGFIATL